MGLGGSVYNDEVHGSSKIGGNISYAHHFSLSSDIKTSLALSAGFLQYRLVKDQLAWQHGNDPWSFGGDVVRSIPDATFGINTYGENWYIGLSIPQLLVYYRCGFCFSHGILLIAISSLWVWDLSFWGFYWHSQ